MRNPQKAALLLAVATGLLLSIPRGLSAQTDKTKKSTKTTTTTTANTAPKGWATGTVKKG